MCKCKRARFPFADPVVVRVSSSTPISIEEWAFANIALHSPFQVHRMCVQIGRSQSESFDISGVVVWNGVFFNGNAGTPPFLLAQVEAKRRFVEFSKERVKEQR